MTARPTYAFILGIDLSVDDINVCLIRRSDQQVFMEKFANTMTGLHALKKWNETTGNTLNDQTLCCLEYTGYNVQQVVQYALKVGLKVWLRTPLQFKRNLRTNGLETKISAAQIASYALLNQERAAPITPNDLVVEKLKGLKDNYSKIAKAILILESSIARVALRDEEIAQALQEINGPALSGLKESLQEAEEKIRYYTFSLKLALNHKLGDANRKPMITGEIDS